jgi:hypothetical protein
VTFAFIEAHEGAWPVRVMCDALEVSPSGYYSWLVRPPSSQEQRREALLVLIRGVHAGAKRRYGSPRVHAALAGLDGARSVNTVAKLMRDNDIRAKTARKFRCRTTDSSHALPVADNVLDRQFDPEAPNEKWVAEIVYSQMTKPAGLAGRPDRERIPDLDVVPGHHDPVDEQLDRLQLPLECRRVETHPHALGERAGRVRAPAQLGRSAHFAREPPLLGRPRLVAALQLRSPTLILTQRDDPAQVGLGQPLDLLGHARSPSPKAFATRLQFLGQPAPAGRPTQRLGHPIRVL